MPLPTTEGGSHKPDTICVLKLAQESKATSLILIAVIKFNVQGLQVLWTGRTASCQNCCRVGQRDKRLVSAIRPRQWTRFRHGFLGNCICCSCEGVYEASVCHTSTRSLFKRTEDEYIPDAESVRQVKEQHQQPQTCSLAQCFQLYTKEEQVDSSHACVNVRLLMFLALTCCVLTSNLLSSSPSLVPARSG